MLCPTFNHTGKKPGVNALCGISSQMLKLIPRTGFAQVVTQPRAVRLCETLSIPQCEEPEL